MRIRIFDKFDESFTCGILDDVECVIGRDIYFTDGYVREEGFDPEFENWEELEQ